MSNPDFLTLAKEHLAQTHDHVRNPTVTDTRAGVAALEAIGAALIAQAEHAKDFHENVAELRHIVDVVLTDLRDRVRVLEHRAAAPQPTQGPTSPPVSPPAPKPTPPTAKDAPHVAPAKTK